MDATTPTGKLISALRQQLKVKGLHYRDVASRLKVSEGTVKRYLSGKGVDIDILQKLAETVDLDLLSLVALAQQQTVAKPGFSTAQKSFLKRSKLAGGVFFMIAAGMTPSQIAAEFDLGKQIDGIIDRLESFGLIRRLSANNFKVTVKSHFDEQAAHAELGVEAARRTLSEMDFHDEKCVWRLHAIRLSRASERQLREAVNRFMGDLRALSRSEMSLPPDETQWYNLFVGAQPVDRKRMMQR